jgi:16S rRNA (guanine966-N2)-methyltransferase
MSHRVISGTARGKRLKMVQGSSTRPIMDRVKEALFNILGTGVVGTRVLDLFAGTGAVGIEALSRGAEWVTFLDKDQNAFKVIRENLESTGFIQRAEVLRQDSFLYLTRRDVTPYGLIYIAPPQYEGLWKRALLALDAQPSLLEPDAQVIIQLDPKEREILSLSRLQPYDERTYGNTLLWFFEYVES